MQEINYQSLTLLIIMIVLFICTGYFMYFMYLDLTELKENVEDFKLQSSHLEEYDEGNEDTGDFQDFFNEHFETEDSTPEALEFDKTFLEPIIEDLEVEEPVEEHNHASSSGVTKKRKTKLTK